VSSAQVPVLADRAQPTSPARRLTLLIDSLAPGGAQTQLLQLAACLQGGGRWQPRVAWYNTDHPFFAVPPGVTAQLLPRRGRRDPQFPLQIRRLGRRQHSDVVHAWLGAPGLYATLAGRLPGMAPVIAAVRNSAGVFQADRTCAAMSLTAAHLAAAVTVNSRDAGDWLAARGVPRRRIHFIANLLTPAVQDRVPSSQEERRRLLQDLGLDPARPPIVALGRFDGYKNQDGLVRALGLVRDAAVARGVEDPKLPPLLLAGFLEDGARVEAVRHLATMLGLSDVHIVPAVTDVATLLEAARFSVLASRSEGTPNVVLEGLGLGTVVVATRVGEVPHLVHDGVTGLLCAVDDDADLARALHQALAMPAADCAAMGRRARADMLERFSTQRIANQYQALYDAVLAGKS